MYQQRRDAISGTEAECMDDSAWTSGTNLCFEIERRSALGLIWIYNPIPEAITSDDTVKDFQGNLQLLLKERIVTGCTDWNMMVSPRIQNYLRYIR